MAHFVRGGFGNDGFVSTAVGAGHPGRLIGRGVGRIAKNTDVGDATRAVVGQCHAVVVGGFTNHQPTHVVLVAGVVVRVVGGIRGHVDREGRVVLRQALINAPHPCLLRIVEGRPVRILGPDFDIVSRGAPSRPRNDPAVEVEVDVAGGAGPGVVSGRRADRHGDIRGGWLGRLSGLRGDGPGRCGAVVGSLGRSGAVRVPLAIAVVIGADDVDAAALVHAKMLRGVKLTEVERVQPIHRLLPCLRVERLKMGFQLPGRQFFDLERVSFSKRLPG